MSLNIKALYVFYKEYLLNSCLPFWINNSLDHRYGGYLTCLDREGKVYNTDKSVWFQGRGAWLYSKLFNSFEKRPEWLKAAKLGYDFLVDHCFDKDGRMFFQVTRDGRPLRKRRYIYSETFAIIACAEYSKASGDLEALKKAVEIYRLVMEIYQNPGITEPKVNPEVRVTKAMAVPMILLATTQSLRDISPDTAYDQIASGLVETLFRDFIKPQEKAMFENVGIDGERLDSPQGRCINPGHSIEASWFIMHEGIYRNDREMITRALEVLDWSLEIGWDKEYGGILSFIDIEGKPPEQLEWDMKLWWPHTEALYALLLAYHLTGDLKYEKWYEKMHAYSFDHFGDQQHKEWYGYLHRDGTVSNTLKGSLWKGPFHLPRALLMNMKLLEKMLAGEAKSLY